VRATYAEIDLEAVAGNVRAFADLIAPAAVCTVVKADAYGHGDVPVATAALEAGASLLAVALVEEGARLREAGIEAPILVLSEPGPDAAAEVVGWELQPSVYSTAFVDALAATGAKIPVHVKVDTGMHRVGAGPAELAGVMEAARAETGRASCRERGSA
jgi:alanine racemase